MTQIIDHGKWQIYMPEKLPEDMPFNTVFARRESDGVDWYEYVRAGTNFGRDTVKFTAFWQGACNGYTVGAVTREEDRLFPADALVLELTEFHGRDPKAELEMRGYDPGTRTLQDLPSLPNPGLEIRERFEALEARIAALEGKR